MESILAMIREKLSPLINRVREKIFGSHNENLDLLVDSFYKLTPPQRSAALAGGASLIVVFILFSIVLYFVQVNVLQTDLDKSMRAIATFRSLKIEDQEVSAKFDSLVEGINRKNKGFFFKPFFEKLSKTLNLEISGVSERDAPLDQTDPLGKKVKVVNVEVKLPKVSIPKLLNFIVELEKSNHLLKVQDIKVTGQYGNKLYFDAQLVIRGYAAGT